MTLVVIGWYGFDFTAVAGAAGSVVVARQSVLSAQVIFVLLPDGHNGTQAC